MCVFLVAPSKKYAFFTSCTISRVGPFPRWLLATLEIRCLMCSMTGVAANRSGATIPLRWLGLPSSPLLASTHRSFIGGLPVSL